MNYEIVKTDEICAYLTESCITLQMNIRALVITGSLVGSCWTLLRVKASMIFLHTSTLMLSFWNRSNRGKNLSWNRNKLNFKLHLWITYKLSFVIYLQFIYWWSLIQTTEQDVIRQQKEIWWNTVRVTDNMLPRKKVNKELEKM